MNENKFGLRPSQGSGQWKTKNANFEQWKVETGGKMIRISGAEHGGTSWLLKIDNLVVGRWRMIRIMRVWIAMRLIGMATLIAGLGWNKKIGGRPGNISTTNSRSCLGKRDANEIPEV